MLGGAGDQSGSIQSTNEQIASVKIGGSLHGGGGEESGIIRSGSAMGAVTIGGDMVGGRRSLTGFVFVDGELANLTIGGSLIGGSAQGAEDLERSGGVFAGRIGALTIGGSVIAGTDNTSGDFSDNGAIRVQFDIGTATIGNLIGNATNPVLVTAFGQETPNAASDLAIGKLTVKGRVEFAQILAGTDQDGIVENADAQIGTVLVGGDLIASSIAAGVRAGFDGQFGTADDAKVTGFFARDFVGRSSRINSLTIGGQAIGSLGGADHFGIVAETIGTVRIGGTLLPTVVGNSNDDTSIGITGDFTLNEI
jgi:hypothetical protein